jgi:hypothetical protein
MAMDTNLATQKSKECRIYASFVSAWTVILHRVSSKT